MRNYLLTVFYFIFLNGLVAGNINLGIDSIDQKLNRLKGDIERAEYLTSIVAHTNKLYPGFVPYADYLVEVANKIYPVKERADFYDAAGKIYYFNFQFNKCIIQERKAVIFYLGINVKHNIFKAYNRISGAYFYLGQYDLSIVENLKALRLAYKLKETGVIVSRNRQIGYNYLYLNRLDSAFFYLNRALEYGLKFNTEQSNAYTYSELGNYWFKMKDYEKSVEYHLKALKIAEKYNNRHAIALIKNRIANTYLKLNKLDLAENYINQVLSFKGIGIKVHNITCRIAAEIFFKKKNYPEAIAYLDTALSINKQLKNYRKIDKIYSIYTEIYLAQNKEDKALYYMQKRFENNELIKQQMLEQQLKNIKILNEIDLFKEKNKKLLEKTIAGEKRIRWYKKITFTTAVFVFITLLFIFFLVNYMKKINVKNRIISLQKEELQAQSEELQIHKEHLEDLVKERTRDLLIAKEKAEESDKLRRSFLHNISHEFRTPMNAILGFTDLLLSEGFSVEQKREFEKIIKKSGFNLLHIVNDIIEISKIQNRQVTLSVTDFNIIIAFKEVIAELEDTALQKGLNFEKRLEVTGNPIVKSDKDKIKSILWHLINNAIKFTKKGEVKVTGKLDDETGMLFFEIKDTGIGIPEDMQEKIFEAFRQVETGTTRNFGGNGIGLAITKAYIEILNGEINLKSKPGEGTTVSFSVKVR